MPPTAHHQWTAPVAPAHAASRVLGMGLCLLLLWVVGCAAVAQPLASTSRPVEWQDTPRISRGAYSAVPTTTTTTTELAAVRHMRARTAPLISAVPAAPLGLRLRMSIDHVVLADAARTRGLGPPLTYVGTKIGVEWKPATSTLGIEHGALGMQLESGYKVSMKVRHGGPSLYLRGSF